MSHQRRDFEFCGTRTVEADVRARRSRLPKRANQSEFFGGNIIINSFAIVTRSLERKILGNCHAEELFAHCPDLNPKQDISSADID